MNNIKILTILFHSLLLLKNSKKKNNDLFNEIEIDVNINLIIRRTKTLSIEQHSLYVIIG